MEQIYSAVAAGNSWLNDIVWGIPALFLLMGAGIILTVGLKGFQFRKFGYAMKNTVGKMFKKQEAKAGEVTPLQALTTALAATVGTGNIAGITTAVTLGGAGAIFWLWVSALLGMATKYSEVLLSVKYRERNVLGDWVGCTTSRTAWARTGSGWARYSAYWAAWPPSASAMLCRSVISPTRSIPLSSPLFPPLRTIRWSSTSLWL